MKQNIVPISEHPTGIAAYASPESLERFETVRDIAKRVQKTPRTVQQWTKQGRIPALKIGKTVLYVWDDVANALRSKFTVNGGVE